MKGLLTGLVVALALLVLSGCGGSGSGSGETEAHGDTRIKDSYGWWCEKVETKYGLCPGNPYFGKTPKGARAARAKALRKSRAMQKAADPYAQAVSWAGKDYSPFSGNSDIAFKWTRGSYTYGGYRWRLNVKTRSACEDLYVEVQIQDKSGSAIDWSNDTASYLSAGQVAKLGFESFKGAAQTAKIVEMSCY